jgi:HSP20 family protein
VNSLFQELDRNGSEGGESVASFAPAVDIYEDEQKVVLKLEIPGIREEDLDIRIEDNTLSVRGERKFEQEEKEENFHRIERRYGSFFRTFSLPTSVDTDSVAANYEAGVLRLTLQKKAESKPKQIKVTMGQQKAVAAKSSAA